jgi:CHASE2 domain-containing sensor protein
MKAVLEYEKMLLSSPLTAIATFALMFAFLFIIGFAFWKRSLKLGLIVLNVSLIGKVALSLLFTGDDGWGPLGTAIFGLILVNGIGAVLLYKKRKGASTSA